MVFLVCWAYDGKNDWQPHACFPRLMCSTIMPQLRARRKFCAAPTQTFGLRRDALSLGAVSLVFPGLLLIGQRLSAFLSTEVELVMPRARPL